MHASQMGWFGSIVVALLGIGWAACAGMGGASDHYPQARKLNLEDIADAAGKAYEREVCDCVRRDFANTLNVCISKLADPDLSDFEMILTIVQDGRVESICLSKETEISGCLREALLDASFPAPPFAPFRSHVSMRLH